MRKTQGAGAGAGDEERERKEWMGEADMGGWCEDWELRIWKFWVAIREREGVGEMIWGNLNV